ncbi:MAG: hypothetical protein V7742_14110 [Halioglobus sp.]
MLIAVCTDDPMVEDICKAAAMSDPDVFGDRWFRVYADVIPDLGAQEDLFIVAHGAAIGDEDLPIIGSKHNAFYLSARDLRANLQGFPSGYAGNVYIYACQSALAGQAERSFVQNYLADMTPSYPGISVYGQTGSPGGPLPLPTDDSWVRAI